MYYTDGGDIQRSFYTQVESTDLGTHLIHHYSWNPYHHNSLHSPNIVGREDSLLVDEEVGVT